MMIQFTELLDEEIEYKANYDPSARVGTLEAVTECEDVRPTRAMEDSMFFLSNKNTLMEIESLFPSESQKTNIYCNPLPILKGTPVLNIAYQPSTTYIFWDKTELFWILEPTKEPNVKIECSNLTYYALNHEIIAIACRGFTYGPEQ